MSAWRPEQLLQNFKGVRNLGWERPLSSDCKCRSQAEHAIRELNNQTFDDGYGGKRVMQVSKAKPRRNPPMGMGQGGPPPGGGGGPGGFGRSPGGGFQVSLDLRPCGAHKGRGEHSGGRFCLGDRPSLRFASTCNHEAQVCSFGWV